MKVSDIKYEDLTNEIVDKILYEGITDDGLNGDCILVFGSKSATKYRVPKAVELSENGRARKIMMSGGNISEMEGRHVLEAEVMREKALELGIPSEHVIIETFSVKSTKENVLGSLIQLDRNFGLNKIKRLLLVTTLYHMKRCLLMSKTYMPGWIEFSLCPANDTNTLRHNWFLSEEGAKRAKGEAFKIISYIKEGSIPDFTI